MPVMFMPSDQEEDRHHDRQEAAAVLLAERVDRDVDADEVEGELDDDLAAARDELHRRVPR